LGVERTLWQEEKMSRHTARSRIEFALAIASGFLFVLTLLTREWIEIVFGVEPDGGSGALEWAITFAFLLAAVGLLLLARRDHRRALAPST
jgi:hypothetical protein